MKTRPPAPPMVLTGVLSKMGIYGFVRLLLPLFPAEIKILGPWLLGLAVCSIVFASLAAWAQSDLKRMVAYLSINHLGYCMLGLFAITATSASSVIDMQAALSGVFMQIFNHGITAAALFYYVGLLEERRGLRGINNFGGLMQRTPLLCGWMSVAMFSSLGLPGLNGFIGEFLIFKGSFAVAASFTAVAVLGFLFTAIVFMRMMQSLFSGPLAESCSTFPDLLQSEKLVVDSRHAAHVRHRRRTAVHFQHLQHHRGSYGAFVCLTSLQMGKEIIPIDRIAQSIHLLRGQKVMLDFDLAALYGVETHVLNQAVKRNAVRFPKDFMFCLDAEEVALLRSQVVTLNQQGVGKQKVATSSSQIVMSSRGVRYRPYAFTEQGVAMLSSVLRSERAVNVNIAIMRAFVKLRDILESNRELARKFAELEKRVGKHDQKIDAILEAIRQLMAPPTKPQREIGFHVREAAARYRTRKRR